MCQICFIIQIKKITLCLSKMYCMKNSAKILSVLFLLTILYFLFYPVSIEPVVFNVPKDPGLKGIFKPNKKLAEASLILKNIEIGPEAVVMASDGMLYTGFENGEIIKFNKAGDQHSIFANTGGRPLGMKFDKNGNLIVADIYKGLLSINPNGKITTLTDKVNGTKIFFADDLDIASDGIIYFSDATQRNYDVMVEAFELQPTGRLLSYNPANKTTKLELENLYFANGVALGPKDEYVLVSETFGLVINKYWLKGSKKGQKEILVDALPGFPDNITYNDAGIFWVAIPEIRPGKAVESLYTKLFLRKMLMRLPEFIINQTVPPKKAMVIGIDENGKVIHNLQDDSGKLFSITSALQVDDHLYLGSLRMTSLAKFKLK